MKMKTSIIILIAFFTLSEAFSQNTSKSYIVTLTNDTISILPKKMSAKKIVGYVNNEKKRFYPRKILAYKFNNNVGEAARACGMIIGFKRWYFLNREITGKVCLYYINMSQNSISDGTNSSVSVEFYKKPGEPRGKIYKFWSWSRLEKYLSDCPEFVEKLNSEETFKSLDEEILYYNAKCN